MKQPFWKTDEFVGMAVSVVFFLAAATGFLQSLELKAYDAAMAMATRLPSDRIAILAIDDQSIQNLGRWPWPRDIHAKLLDLLAKGHPKAIGHTVFFVEPQRDPGLLSILDIEHFVDQSSLTGAATEAGRLRELLQAAQQTLAAPVPRSTVRGAGATPPPAVPDTRTLQADLARFIQDSPLLARLPEDTRQLRERLQTAGHRLDTDRILAQSMGEAGNLWLSLALRLGEPQGNPDPPPPGYVKRHALNWPHDTGGLSRGLPVSAIALLPPIPALGEVAAGLGHVNLNADGDGVVRTEALMVRYFDETLPSLALALAAKSLNLRLQDIRIDPGRGVSLGKLNLKTDENLRLRPFFYRGRNGKPAFPVDSLFDVYSGKIPPSKYQDRLVLIGATAIGLGDSLVTPVAADTHPVEVTAHILSSILNEHFIVSPAWAVLASRLAILTVALYLVILLPRLYAGMAAGFTAGLLVTLFGTHFYLMGTRSLWVELMTPAVLLVIGHLLLTTKRFLMTERSKLTSDREAAESHRMLGLAFQGQGQLDMAFEKFRRSPIDDELMDLIYNLAMDFERKRQFGKAGAVLGYLASHNPRFRDIRQRMQRYQSLEETVVLGRSKGDATMVLSGRGVQKPMLGRYQVEKELGKGAMGVVYLGRDPKINRVVAIKTMALAQEFEGEELVEVKERFFREAETAGRLSHAHIVTIFDAGEEQDLAYIAMEFLKGQDLTVFTKRPHLLPPTTVLDLARQIAEALDYAHRQQVVHRDIKPANIMYDPESGILKVTDFGIARITDASRTKTGIVLGTPSYMSPEQVVGYKVDGRSDLFSLGVMLYQLLSGELPFRGDSVAQLLFRTANEIPPDIAHLQPDLPSCVATLLDKALQKEPSRRYQTGEAFAEDLARCLDEIRRHAGS